MKISGVTSGVSIYGWKSRLGRCMGGIADYGAQPPYANGGSYTNDEGVTFFVP